MFSFHSCSNDHYERFCRSRFSARLTLFILQLISYLNSHRAQQTAESMFNRTTGTKITRRLKDKSKKKRGSGKEFVEVRWRVGMNIGNFPAFVFFTWNLILWVAEDLVKWKRVEDFFHPLSSKEKKKIKRWKKAPPEKNFRIKKFFCARCFYFKTAKKHFYFYARQRVREFFIKTRGFQPAWVFWQNWNSFVLVFRWEFI